MTSGAAFAPDLRAALDRAIAAACEFVVASTPALIEAIILTGSFARDEGSLYIDNGSVVVLGDLEFLVVVAPGTDRRMAQNTMDAAAVELHATMSPRFLCDFEFRAVGLEYFQQIEPHIFGYELMRHGRIVWGATNALDAIPRFTPADIPLSDAWRMLNNRLLEQLSLVETVRSQSRSELLHALYSIAKCYIDLGTSTLLFFGHYRSTYGGRCEALHRVVQQPDYAWLKPLSAAVSECTEFKLAPFEQPSLLGVVFHASTPDFQHSLTSAAQELVRISQIVWRTLAARFAASSASSSHALQRAVFAVQPMREKLRGWAKLASMPRVASQRESLRRTLRLWNVASPRYLVYAVATSLFFVMPLSASSPPAINFNELANLLPVRVTSQNTWFALRDDVFHCWYAFMRNHWA